MKKVLILDDAVHIADKIARIVEKIGEYIPYVAYTAKKAKEIFEIEKPDLGIFDIKLHSNDVIGEGINLAKSLNSIHPFPTAFLTSYSNIDDFWENAHGIDHSIFRKKNLRSLSQTIQRAIFDAEKKYKNYFPNPSLVKGKFLFTPKDFDHTLVLHKDEILYLMSDKIANTAITHVATTSEKVHIYGANLGNAEKKLNALQKDGWQFFRISKECIVNLEKIKSIGRDKSLKLEGTNRNIIVSRKYATELFNRFSNLNTNRH